MRKSALISLGIAVSITVLAVGIGISAQDKYTVEVPGGLAFSEFRGYEDWSVVAMSENGGGLTAADGARSSSKTSRRAITKPDKSGRQT
ncbi:MAG: hypothetical protein WA728_21830 [Xanthobacteraceae bacterium]